MPIKQNMTGNYRNHDPLALNIGKQIMSLTLWANGLELLIFLRRPLQGCFYRRNYREADNIDYEDGDFASSIYYQDPSYENSNNRMYDWGKTTLISDRARVYKGGAWDDRAYYIQPATRRFLDEREATATIGFRCAMTRVGSPRGMGNNKRK